MFICYITLFALTRILCENIQRRVVKIICTAVWRFFSSSWGFHFNFLRMLCQICVYFWSLLRYFKFPHSFIQNQLHFFFAQLKKIMNGWFGWLPFFNHNLLLFYVMLHFASCTISRQFVLKTCCSTKISWHNLQAINQRIVVALQDPRCC